jgi:hypothetical protein
MDNGMTDATRRALLSTYGVRAGWDMAFFVAEIKTFGKDS